MKRRVVDLLIVAGVLALVVGVAWYRSGRTPPVPHTQPAAAGLPRVLDLGAGKCKACKELAPILEELRREYAGRVVVDYIDVWQNPKAAEQYSVNLIPTQIFFDREGREVWRHEGFLPKAEFVARFVELGAK